MKQSIAAVMLVCAVTLVNPVRVAPAQSGGPPAMDNQRLEQLLKRIDPGLAGRTGLWSLDIEGFQTLVITDQRADRMRVLVRVAATESLDRDRLYRTLQANFDAALDARYCIAKGALWSAFIHPLSPLTEKQLFSALAQTVNLAATYGTTYNSGALVFGGGDSRKEQAEYFRRIMEKANAI